MSNSNEVDKKLDAILYVVRRMFLLQAKKAGLSRNAARKILKIDVREVSAIWRLIRLD